MTAETLKSAFKKIFFGFPCCSTYENLFYHVPISCYCRTDIDEARVISFLGVLTDGRTDRHSFGILTWKHVGIQKNFNSKLKIRS